MTTATIFLSFLGFYLCYATSKKMAGTGKLGVETWANKNKRPANVLGLLLLLAALVLSFFSFGIGAGTLTWFIIIMTVGSLIVLLTPLQLISYKTLALAIAVSIVIEYFLI